MKKKKKSQPVPATGNMVTTPLVGHSGCKIVLIQSQESAFVRKTSGSKAYNDRLKKQCEKQKNFQGTDRIKAPEILNSGFDAHGLFFFEMQYIGGQTYANYIENSANLNPKLVAEDFYELLQHKKGLVDSRFSDQFQHKIESLSTELPGTKTVQEALSALKNYSWKPELLSPCHGDLTLENILVSRDGHIYLIDFLDSFCDSWIVDLGKLLQDLELQWSFRNKSGNPFRSIRLSVIRETLLNRFRERPEGEQIVQTAYYSLLLHILRIFPYSPPEMTDYLNELLLKTLKKINSFDNSLKGVG